MGRESQGLADPALAGGIPSSVTSDGPDRRAVCSSPATELVCQWLRHLPTRPKTGDRPWSRRDELVAEAQNSGAWNHQWGKRLLTAWAGAPGGGEVDGGGFGDGAGVAQGEEKPTGSPCRHQKVVAGEKPAGSVGSARGTLLRFRGSGEPSRCGSGRRWPRRSVLWLPGGRVRTARWRSGYPERCSRRRRRR